MKLRRLSGGKAELNSAATCGKLQMVVQTCLKVSQDQLMKHKASSYLDEEHRMDQEKK